MRGIRASGGSGHGSGGEWERQLGRGLRADAVYEPAWKYFIFHQPAWLTAPLSVSPGLGGEEESRCGGSRGAQGSGPGA